MLTKVIVLSALIPVLAVSSVLAQTTGDGSITKWKGGSTAAVTISIDDNQKPDHAWWTSTANAYDFNPTWFVITDRVGTNFGGEWSDFQTLRNNGHDIQSHTVDHFPNFPNGDPLTLHENYGLSQQAIQDNLPGSVVTTLAYPFGFQAPNDKSIAEQYYIGARGTRGLLNGVNTIDYMNVDSLSLDAYSNGFAIPGGSLPSTHRAYVPNLVTEGHQHYQGVLSVHAHSLNDDKKTALTDLLDYLNQDPDDYWIDGFSSIVQYGQQRDAATLTTEVIGNDEIQFSLTDSLDDASFFEPLTVKIQLDQGWFNVIARQNGELLNSKVIVEDGLRYALVDSIPDRGMVSLTAVPEPSSLALMLIASGIGLGFRSRKKHVA